MTLTPRTYVRIEREWHTGDTVTITLPMDVSVRGWRKNHDAVSVERGPLTYSLKIGEKYVPTTGPKPWVGCEILPTTAWNYGLVLDGATPGESFQVVERSFPDSMTPFTQESAPVELKAKGKRIPQWKQDYLGLVGLLQDSPVKSSEPEERITLIPMGAARLRVSSFPVISDAPSAHEWVTPPEVKPTRASASHCFGGDSVRAVEDGRIPKKSSDHSIPRFTWWDHRGTKEWVQREFDRASVSKVRVYWFDDEPVGGKCRTPESWRVMYRKDGQWAPVTGASASGVTKDQFNDVTFDAVTTDALRLEVKLRDGFSSGVLEWEIK